MPKTFTCEQCGHKNRIIDSHQSKTAKKKWSNKTPQERRAHGKHMARKRHLDALLRRVWLMDLKSGDPIFMDGTPCVYQRWDRKRWHYVWIDGKEAKVKGTWLFPDAEQRSHYWKLRHKRKAA